MSGGTVGAVIETPPPRRGRPQLAVYALAALGNTPAEAGKTRVGSEAVRLLQKHPRRGGEDFLTK